MAQISAGDRPIHIMTSCDEKLSVYVSILIHSIAENLPDKKVHFYLFYSRVEEKSLQRLEKQCREYGNIEFHSIRVPNPEEYEALAEHGGWYSEYNGVSLSWGGEAYYSLGAWKLLPENVDRILYVDAGDVLITGDISPYYFEDFDDCSLLVTGTVYKIVDGMTLPLESDDLTNPMFENQIIRGVFNSGSYILNLEKMRREDVSMEAYIDFAKALREVGGSDRASYMGDQGFLSAVYLGDIKYYGFPEIRNIWYMPYNFCMWFFDQMKEKPEFDPAIVHFAGTYLPFKAQCGQYPVFLERFQKKEELRSLRELNLGQAEYYYLWHEYAMKTEAVLQKVEAEEA